ncbi:MAG: riboflavin synthase [Dehalococcoidia bacterium]|nr:riboflavin synthase [Dehalococcoidia bacterium]
MFTGIIEEIGRVSQVTSGKLTVKARKVLGDTGIGDSIAVNGVCLTVADITTDSFMVDIMPETLRHTNLGALRPGGEVNLERALSFGGRLGGHLVQGHIDDTGKVSAIKPEGPAVIMRFTAPREVLRYVVKKGFIAVDGTSLTVVEKDNTSFSVSLVTLTRQLTTLSKKRVGDTVNLEVDIIAKYVEALAQSPRTGVTAEFLQEHGFLVK